MQSRKEAVFWQIVLLLKKMKLDYLTKHIFQLNKDQRLVSVMCFIFKGATIMEQKLKIRVTIRPAAVNTFYVTSWLRDLFVVWGLHK